MKDGTAIRQAQFADLPAVLVLWADAGVEPSHTDDLNSLQRLLAHDPCALLVAEEDGQILGSVIAAWDGWRGSIYRLAVAPPRRRSGLGRRLLQESHDRLTARGARRLQAVVVETDIRATGFWRATDWAEQIERLRFTNG